MFQKVTFRVKQKKLISFCILTFILINCPSFSQNYKNSYDAYRLFVNKLDISFNKTGVIGDVSVAGPLGGNPYSGGLIDDIRFLYSGGFVLSGISNGVTWVNAVASASRIQDYISRPVGSNRNDLRNHLYLLDSRSDELWSDWKDAVSLGADFYDGDNDGIYNPVDKNLNGKWDANEDKPDFISNKNLWCVYNDGMLSELRRFIDVAPQGIEIQQTVFAQSASNYLNNVIFIRYRIINRGLVTDEMDSCYFSIWTDPEIGDTYDDDDLTGCDTTLNLGFSYNDSSDMSFGNDPPAFGTQLVQGPISFIPGKTFNDINKNNKFDSKIDIPLDTAYIHKGLLGIDTIVGAKNIEISSYLTFYYYHHAYIPEARHYRSYQLGWDLFGGKVNPCDFAFGSVYPPSDCNKVNPLFWFSGDPVSKTGWINNTKKDQRMMTNVGPFKLIKNEPQDIIVAYIVARGTDALNSVTEMKKIAKSTPLFVKQNFGINIPSNENTKPEVVNTFRLEQNYPNPFNPGTTINYELAKEEKVAIKVYDLLGNEVATLIEEIKPAGKHTIKFDGSKLSSGVYFYRLITSSRILSRKMILLK